MMGVDLYIEVSSKRIKPGKASFVMYWNTSRLQVILTPSQKLDA